MSTSPTPDQRNTEPNRWYLAYGSNLSSKTFRGRRGIRPLAQANVLVPSLELTFDLGGIPYWEPCFANVRRRKDLGSDTAPASKQQPALIGVAYLITPEDYAKVIATEGGGTSYKEFAVECWRLPENIDEKSDNDPVCGDSLRPVQDDPKERLLAYTLLAPDTKRRLAPVQPSKRYINIIRAGAREHHLPTPYITYLDSIPHYHATSFRQQVGAALFLATWLPFLLFVLTLNKIFVDRETGRLPKWLGSLAELAFPAMWRNYEYIWKPIFGNGERTENTLKYSEKGVFDGIAVDVPPAPVDFHRL